MKTLDYFRLVKDTRVVRVRRLAVLVIPAILLVGRALLGLSDTDISVADTSVPNNERAGSVSKAGNSSSSAAITITMYAVANE